ncbi:MAG TPA: TolC family protein [Terracidiphilus sp.]|jgi:cobalt-zinc-cadmium efflux system outer membrane protein|nr:TolC family protein [Terracidiphilus sp.]
MATGERGAAQENLNWDQAKARFEATNPVLKVDEASVEEMKAEEVTAFLRPNPQLTLAADGTQIAPHDGVWTPLKGTTVQLGVSYLHEREHKRELRLQSAKEGTEIAGQEHADLERQMEFTLRSAFVQTMEARAVLDLARSDLDYYDRVIGISRERLRAGDIAEIDLDRIELLRVQYESEIQTALVNLHTAKIALLQLLDDKTPVEHFDVTGTFDFSDTLQAQDAVRQAALTARPDLQAALQTIEQSKTNHKLAVANGSTDPTFSGWYTWNASTNNPNGNQTIGGSVNIPLRIFDHNQGEKQRTLIDLDRSQQASEATRAQVLSDVDTTYAVVQSSIALLKSYKDHYNEQAVRVRDTVTYSYEHGGASLMDFLSAQSDYRQVRLAYVQLIGAYLTAAGQLNLAVGREVIEE